MSTQVNFYSTYGLIFPDELRKITARYAIPIIEINTPTESQVIDAEFENAFRSLKLNHNVSDIIIPYVYVITKRFYELITKNSNVLGYPSRPTKKRTFRNWLALNKHIEFIYLIGFAMRTLRHIQNFPQLENKNYVRKGSSVKNEWNEAI